VSVVQTNSYRHGEGGAFTGVHSDRLRGEPRHSVHQRAVKRIRERMAMGGISDNNGGNSASVDRTKESANENSSGGHLKPALFRLFISEWGGVNPAFRLASCGSNSWDASRCISIPVGAISNRNRGRALVQENMTILSPTSISAGLIAAILIFQSVTPWWQGVIIAVVGAPLAALIALWFNAWQFKRNRHVELEKAGDQSYAELGHVVLELTDKERARLESALQRVAEQAEKVHAKELEFLQQQLRHRGNLEVQARNRTHSALAEVQRCVMTIRAHEEMLRVAHVEFMPFHFKSYEEIIGEDKIPTIDEDARS
jgi:hypothetical protein